MNRVFTVTIVALLVLYPTALDTAMSSGDFEIYSDSFSVVNTDVAASNNFSLYSTGGEVVSTSTASTSGSISLKSGFQAAEKGILSYTLSDSSLDLGTLSDTSIALNSMTVTVSTDSETGYSLVVTEDGNLRSGANDIDDVADGAVSVGVEEYGLRTVGDDGQLANDTAITGSLVVASRNGASPNQSTPMEFRASIDGSTAAGSYSHVLTYTVTVNP